MMRNLDDQQPQNHCGLHRKLKIKHKQHVEKRTQITKHQTPYTRCIETVAGYGHTECRQTS